MSRRQKTGGQLLNEAAEVNHQALVAKDAGYPDEARACFRDKVWLVCTATLENPREIAWSYDNGVIIVHQRGENRKKHWPSVPVPLRALEGYIGSNGFSEREVGALRRRLEATIRSPKKSGRSRRCRRTDKPWKSSVATRN